MSGDLFQFLDVFSLIDSGNMFLDGKIKDFLTCCKDKHKVSSLGEEIAQLVRDAKYDVLEKIMMDRLTFGTAGIRGRMGPGFAAMNDVVVIQTSQGLCSYIEKQCGDEAEKKNGVVIGYDSRYNSHRFADLAAVAFLQKSFKVYVFSHYIPTPFIPFAVRKLKCLAGIMITASHNPKEDNGYKVYWKNGAQILPKEADGIEEEILKNQEPWEQAYFTELVWTSPCCYDVASTIEELYFEDLKICFKNRSVFPDDNKLKITFTALHGVSHAYIKRAFQMFSYSNFVAVTEQMYPEPDFPTVLFPNPEERNCLNLAIKTANCHDSHLILANDPDVDRLAVAEKIWDPSTGFRWHIYSGNEIGAILGSFLWENTHPEWKKRPDNCCMISTAVSSKILRSIAAKEGFFFYETLTGFKWIANKAIKTMDEGKNFIFAFEEAIGYMCGSMVLDKDGIQTAMHLASMAAFAYSKGNNLYNLLKETYLKYGYHVTRNSYFICNDGTCIKNMFEKLRHYKDQFSTVSNHSISLDSGHFEYPACLINRETSYPVAAVRDLTVGCDTRQSDNRATLPCSSSTQMITFYFTNGCEATLRVSGTEPKIKYYTEMIAEVPESSWAEIDKLLEDIVEAIIEKWIQPDLHGFLRRQT